MADEVIHLTQTPKYQKLTIIQELQKATASEPLSLAAEYEMQKSWRKDADKLTFIACLPTDITSKEDSSKHETIATVDDAPDRMIGDVNLFLFEENDDSEDIRDETVNIIGEIEIMIARKDLQGRGYGNAVLLNFIWYIVTNTTAILTEFVTSLGKQEKVGYALKYLRVKIDVGNERSIKLFEKVGFRKVSEKPNYFGEVELRWEVTESCCEEILHKLQNGKEARDTSDPVVCDYMLDKRL
jgi:RimJ/RimL family protein N-acetyltransferase